MAKPRVFISSTFYDLRQIRADIDQFIKSLGYEPVRNEEGSIPYGKEDHLEQYCYQEIQNCDILISIIGGHFGTETKDGSSVDKYIQKSSISQNELKKAREHEKQVYIFIDKNVSAEFQTYLLNKGNNNIKYRYVDDIRIYNFIEEIKNLVVNNNIKEFETSEDITSYLREQFAGLFQRFMESKVREKEINLISDLERTISNLNQIVKFLSDINKDHKAEVNSILKLNHPLVNWLRTHLGIKYCFYINGLSDLKQLMKAFHYGDPGETKDLEGETVTYYVWSRQNFDNSSNHIQISASLFDTDGSLIQILQDAWTSQMAMFETIEAFQQSYPFNDDDNDLPF